MIQKDGGQKVIKEFQKSGVDLYSEAPEGVDPLGKVSALLQPVS